MAEEMRMLLRSRCLSRLLLLLLLLSGARALFAQVTSGTVHNLISHAGGMALDNSGSTTAGTAMAQTPVTAGNTDQQWQIVSLGNGEYRLICLRSGMVLDTGGATTTDSPVIQNPLTSATNADQIWAIATSSNGYYQLVSVVSGMVLDDGGSTAAGGSVLQAAPVSGDASQIWQITPVQIGAITPFVPYEAESGTLAGGASIISLASQPTTEFSILRYPRW
jgi:hypothetical protein